MAGSLRRPLFGAWLLLTLALSCAPPEAEAYVYLWRQCTHVTRKEARHAAPVDDLDISFAFDYGGSTVTELMGGQTYTVQVAYPVPAEIMMTTTDGLFSGGSCNGKRYDIYPRTSSGTMSFTAPIGATSVTFEAMASIATSGGFLYNKVTVPIVAAPPGSTPAPTPVPTPPCRPVRRRRKLLDGDEEEEDDDEEEEDDDDDDEMGMMNQLPPCPPTPAPVPAPPADPATNSFTTSGATPGGSVNGAVGSVGGIVADTPTDVGGPLATASTPPPPGGEEVAVKGSPARRQVVAAHGAVMAVAWLGLAPLGGLAARLLPHRGTAGLRAARALTWGAIFLTGASIALAFAKLGGSVSNNSYHGLIGCFAFVAALAQAAAGRLRPGEGEPGHAEWVAAYRASGLFVWGLAGYCLATGLVGLEDEGMAAAPWARGAAAAVCVLAACAAVMAVDRRINGAADDLELHAAAARAAAKADDAAATPYPAARAAAPGGSGDPDRVEVITISPRAATPPPPRPPAEPLPSYGPGGAPAPKRSSWGATMAGQQLGPDNSPYGPAGV